MELPVVDLSYLPVKFRKLFVSSQDIIRTAYLIDSDRIDKIPLRMRMNYINVFHMHFGMLSERHNDSEELKASKNRFNIFDSISGKMQAMSIKDKAGLMAELAQICLVVTQNSLSAVRKNPKFSKVNADLVGYRTTAENEIKLLIMNAYRIALAYAKYADEKLIQAISPLVIRMGMDTVGITGLVVPSLPDNQAKAMYLDMAFSKTMKEIRALTFRIDYTNGFIDPEDHEYSDALTQKYIEIGKNYLTYPMVFQKEEVELK